MIVYVVYYTKNPAELRSSKFLFVLIFIINVKSSKFKAYKNKHKNKRRALYFKNRVKSII